MSDPPRAVPPPPCKRGSAAKSRPVVVPPPSNATNPPRVVPPPPCNRGSAAKSKPVVVPPPSKATKRSGPADSPAAPKRMRTSTLFRAMMDRQRRTLQLYKDCPWSGRGLDMEVFSEWWDWRFRKHVQKWQAAVFCLQILFNLLSVWRPPRVFQEKFRHGTAPARALFLHSTERLSKNNAVGEAFPRASPVAGYAGSRVLFDTATAAKR